MDFDAWIQQGWGRHEKETAALAADLEARFAEADDGRKALVLVNLANHAIGEHLGDWDRARSLAERVLADRADAPDLALPLGNLAVAQQMAGDGVAAAATEARAVRLAGADAVSSVVRTRTLLAAALVGSRRLDEAARVYEAALALARAQEGPLACDRVLAMTSNNLAGALLGTPERGEPETALLLEAAAAAHEFWLKCGTWENEERAEYLLACVHNQVGPPEQALRHATRGLEVIAQSGEEKVDEAFLHLAAAQAHRRLGDASASDAALARADRLAATFGDDGLQAWFADERAKVASGPRPAVG